MVNEATPLHSTSDPVDKVLIEMGLPLSDSLVTWSSFQDNDPKSYTYAPVDDDTRLTLIEMERLRNQAFKNQDYEKLKSLVQDLKLVFEVTPSLHLTLI